jgi:hypothetical protein
MLAPAKVGGNSITGRLIFDAAYGLNVKFSS